MNTQLTNEFGDEGDKMVKKNGLQSKVTCDVCGRVEIGDIGAFTSACDNNGYWLTSFGVFRNGEEAFRYYDQEEGKTFCYDCKKNVRVQKD